MAFSPTLNHPITLPLQTLSVPASDTPPRPVHPPSLRIGIIVHVLGPTPLISEHTSGRQLEECVDLVIPVGGHVGIGLEVEAGDILEGTSDLQKEMDMEDEVRTRVRDIFLQVSLMPRMCWMQSTILPTPRTRTF